MPAGAPWTVKVGDGPVVALAVHAGHQVRRRVETHLAISPRARRVEEDPFTDDLTEVSPTSIVVHRSRFEVDLNRSRERAVYRRPGDAWGLRVWAGEPPRPVVQASLDLYDRFYTQLHQVLARAGAGGRPFVVLDLHSYNHRRGGPGAPPADPRRNPEINIGTGSVDRERFGPLVDGFMAGLAGADLGLPGRRHLDVRENVRFRGGHLTRWVHANFPGQACGLAVEVKKFFMDEHTGRLDEPTWAAVRQAFAAATTPGLLEALAEVPPAVPAGARRGLLRAHATA